MGKKFGLEKFPSYCPIESEIILYDSIAKENAEVQKFFQSRIKAVRSVGANVLAYWSKKEIGDTEWKSGKALYTPIWQSINVYVIA